MTKLPNQEELFPSGCSDERTASLHINSVNPDVIIINMGTNDWAFGAKTGEETSILDDIESEFFADAYKTMIQKIKLNYPESEVWCCTLSETFISNKPEFSFPHKYAGIHIEEYNEIIRRIVREEECKLIDLYNMKMPYDSIDGSHPNKDGMQTIAASVCYAMCDKTGRDFLALDKKGNDEEYVFIDSSITTILYNGTISLTDICTGKELKIKESKFNCGRNNDCTIKLDSPSVARNHATFFYENNNWFIRDNNTISGTRVNDVRLEPNKKYQLLGDDIIEFADAYKYIFYKTKTENETSTNLKAHIKAVEEESLIGKMVGDKYQLQEIIGNGGMTKVYLAADSSNKKYAVKSVFKNTITHKDVLDAILSEVKLLQTLKHPYIRKALEQIEDETHIFIVLEYVEGINLEELASKSGGILPVEKVLRYTIQIAEALQYIHSFNPPIINRDIKPRNILIDVEDKVRLVDFDIAMEYNPLLEDTCVLGTKGYAPPEQYVGKTTPRSDIFSLGMVMHQLLTGVSPVEAPYETNLIRQYNPSYSKGLERIVEKCIRPDPDERFLNASELIDVLKKELSKDRRKGVLEKIGFKIKNIR